jgi:radical SAM protein with 4Fe4S-binding SPASM domain
MTCRFCGAWEFGKEAKMISVPEARQALKAGRQSGYFITTFTGGEPLMHPDFCDILEYAHSLGYWIVVTTNGLMLREEILKSLKKCRALVRVSLHTLDAEQHREITGTNTLEQVLDNLSMLHKNNVSFSIGSTIFDENITQIGKLAELAWKEGALFIRYTPVVSIRGAEDMLLLPAFFKRMLECISDLSVMNLELLEHGIPQPRFRQELLDCMLTRRCAAGSRQHIIFDSSGRVVSCSFLPENMGLCSGYDGEAADRFQQVHQKMDDFHEKVLKGNLNGRCGDCRFAGSCLGGCLTTKLAYGLKPCAEQPVCVREIIEDILEKYSPEQKDRLIDYWSVDFRKKSTGAEKSKYCMRHLPIWQLTFRCGINRSLYELHC